MFQTSMNACCATGMGHAKERAPTPGAVTSVHVTAYRAHGWPTTGTLATTWTSVGTARPGVRTSASTRWDPRSACVLMDCNWTTAGKSAWTWTSVRTRSCSSLRTFAPNVVWRVWTRMAHINACDVEGQCLHYELHYIIDEWTVLYDAIM